MIEALVGALALSLGFTLALSRRVEARYPASGRLVDLGRGRLHVVETAPEAASAAILDVERRARASDKGSEKWMFPAPSRASSPALARRPSPGGG